MGIREGIFYGCLIDVGKFNSKESLEIFGFKFCVRGS